MIEEGDEWQKCLVCQAPVSTLHLGMDVCRLVLIVLFAITIIVY